MSHTAPVPNQAPAQPAAAETTASFAGPGLLEASSQFEQCSQAIEQLWNVSRINQEAIRFADTKAAAVFTADFAMSALLAGLSASPHPIFSLKSHLTEVMLIIGAISIATSAGFCLYAFYPKLVSSGSPLYFGDIISAHANQIDFHDKAHKAYSSQEQLMLHLSNQVWVTSKILMDKFKLVQWAIRFLIPAAAISLSAIVATNWPIVAPKKDSPCTSAYLKVSSPSSSPTLTAPLSSPER